MEICRVVIESEAQSGVRNMAVDEALLEAALERGQCTVRWYRWATATVSLGYFQDAAAAATAPGLAGLPVVRRLTGGGAILHHHELTYSCALPQHHPLAATPLALYKSVHEQILAVLAHQGIQAALRGQALPDREGAFLCFGRGDPRDIVLAGHKIVGSAQRRRRGAVLQHGSVLIKRSEHAPQFPGLADLAPQEQVAEMAFSRAVGQRVGAILGAPEIAALHDSAVEARASELEPKYQSLDWLKRHLPPNDAETC